MIFLATKKLKSAARYGARYGVGVKKRVLKIEAKQKRKHACPNCGFRRAKRKSAGIYACTKCGSRFAGGAYIPSTMTGRTIQKMVSQKSFLPKLAELIESREKALEGGFSEAEESEGGSGGSEEASAKKEKRQKKAPKATIEKADSAEGEQ